jgi:hypothetical protein
MKKSTSTGKNMWGNFFVRKKIYAAEDDIQFLFFRVAAVFHLFILGKYFSSDIFYLRRKSFFGAMHIELTSSEDEHNDARNAV